MTIIDQLASSLKRRDETPNIELAKKIVAKKDKAAVDELLEHLGNKSKDIQHDVIKVLYEVAVLKPELISQHYKIFIGLLKSKNNRMQWGAMHALDAITGKIPKEIFNSLGVLNEAADKGSVITRDHFVAILIKLYSMKEYTKKVFPLLIEQLKFCPTNQLPMYAENLLPVIQAGDKKELSSALSSRLNAPSPLPARAGSDGERAGGEVSDTKRNRLEKVIKKLS